MTSATSFFWGTIGSGLYAAQIMGLGTTSTRQWRIPVTPRPEKEPVSYCAVASSRWFARARYDGLVPSNACFANLAHRVDPLTILFRFLPPQMGTRFPCQPDLGGRIGRRA